MTRVTHAALALTGESGLAPAIGVLGARKDMLPSPLLAENGVRGYVPAYLAGLRADCPQAPSVWTAADARRVADPIPRVVSGRAEIHVRRAGCADDRHAVP